MIDAANQPPDPLGDFLRAALSTPASATIPELETCAGGASPSATTMPVFLSSTSVPADAPDSAAARDAGRTRRPAQRDSLMALTAHCELWRDENGEAFVTHPLGGHMENWPIRSSGFKRWLASRAYREFGLAPTGQALDDALRVLEARAANEGPVRTPWLRTGARDGKIYIDLCDPEWRVVEVDGSGWRIIDRPDAPFIRTRSMRPLPTPEGGESVNVLRSFLNVADDAGFSLAVAWLVAALRPTGPYPILVINGEQGTGKSNFSKFLRSLIDPCGAPIRTPPREERDLVIAASSAHVLAFDNLSKVDPWQADALCRLATGGGFSTRQLYTDRDEAVFQATRPIILNGIPALTDRPDLADRAITIRLRPIPETERRSEDELWADWSRIATFAFGALLDGVSAGIRNLPDVTLRSLPRLADFAKFVTACEPGLGWEPGVFLDHYASNRRETTDSAFEADPVAIAMFDLAKSCGSEGWRGTPTELLEALSGRASETVRRSRSWPTTAQGLGARLQRVAPLLRDRSVEVQRRHSGERFIELVYRP